MQSLGDMVQVGGYVWSGKSINQLDRIVRTEGEAQ